MTDLRTAAQQALEALETPIHEQSFMQKQNAITALRAALAGPPPAGSVQDPVRELLISAAAMAVVTERKGAYPGASWVADAVLESALPQPAQPVQEPCNPSCAPGYCYCAAQQAEPVEPVKLWCETCEGTGKVYQEPQAGCHVGGDLQCPDCDGSGYIESRKYFTAPPQRRPLSDADLAKIWDDALDQLDPRDQLRFIARAIERAHKIGGQQ